MHAQIKQTHETLVARNARQNHLDSPSYQRNSEMLALALEADDDTARAILRNCFDAMNVDAAFVRAAGNAAMTDSVGSLGVDAINNLKHVLSASSRSQTMPPHRLASFITAFAAELTKLEQS